MMFQVKSKLVLGCYSACRIRRDLLTSSGDEIPSVDTIVQNIINRSEMYK